MRYKKLKAYFLTTELPKTLDGGEHRFYFNVPNTVKLYMDQLDEALKTESEPSKITLNVKHQLDMLYEALQVKDKWDKPRPEWNSFHNKSGIN